MSDEQATKRTQELVDHCKRVMDDRTQLEALENDPLSILESLSIPVEDQKLGRKRPSLTKPRLI